MTKRNPRTVPAVRPRRRTGTGKAQWPGGRSLEEGTLGYPRSLIQVAPRDLSPYRRSNTGIDYVHTLDSGVTGPHFVVNSLSKGNEICGSEAVATLLDDGVHPTRGRLTLGFANVEAYRQLDVHDPAPSKFLDVNFNRIWKDEILDGPHSGSVAREVERARRMRPVVRDADILLDLLSDCFYRAPNPWHDPPLLSYIEKPAARRLADRIGFPLHHIGCPPGASGEHSGLLFEYGRFSDRESAAAGFLAECGPHFARASVANSLNVTARFLRALDMVDRDTADRYGAFEDAGEIAVYTDMVAPAAESDSFRWAGEFHGHETFSKGELIATDGARRIEAPWDDCVLITVAEDVRKGEGIGHLIRRIR